MSAPGSAFNVVDGLVQDFLDRNGRDVNPQVVEACVLLVGIDDSTIPEQALVEMGIRQSRVRDTLGIFLCFAISRRRFLLAESLLTHRSRFMLFDHHYWCCVGHAIGCGAPPHLIGLLLEKGAPSVTGSIHDPPIRYPAFNTFGFASTYTKREVIDIAKIVLEDAHLLLSLFSPVKPLSWKPLWYAVRNNKSEWLASPELLRELIYVVAKHTPNFTITDVALAFTDGTPDSPTNVIAATRVGGSAVFAAKCEAHYLPLLVGVKAGSGPLFPLFVRHPLYTRDVLRAVLQLVK